MVQRALEGKAVPLSIRAHFEHHKRFYTAAALGILIWTLTRMFALPVHLAVAGDAFFGVYLLSTLGMAHRATPSEMRTRAAVKDEGIVLIVLMTLACYRAEPWLDLRAAERAGKAGHWSS